ncbi:hypothetical protein ABZ330_03545 [Streptomyces sp. NPDC006172]
MFLLGGFQGVEAESPVASAVEGVFEKFGGPAELVPFTEGSVSAGPDDG